MLHSKKKDLTRAENEASIAKQKQFIENEKMKVQKFKTPMSLYEKVAASKQNLIQPSAGGQDRSKSLSTQVLKNIKKDIGNRTKDYFDLI